MGKKPRPRPQRLATKLLAIRQGLCFSQSEMIRLLRVQVSTARISEYESGTREPSLIVLLRYAKVAGVCVDELIDDDVQLNF